MVDGYGAFRGTQCGLERMGGSQEPSRARMPAFTSIVATRVAGRDHGHRHQISCRRACAGSSGRRAGVILCVMSSRDSDRPPVLAHQRFVEEKESFAGLSLEQRFRRIHDTNLWGALASSSGLGSEIDATAMLRAELPRLLERIAVASLIDRLRARAAEGEVRGEYHLADITRDPLPRCDAVLCRDALVHLSFANIERAVANFKASGAVWLIATTFPEWQSNGDCEDGDWRALNFEIRPFSWGPPLELLNENCTEAGGGWRDKSLGVWRLS